MKQPLSAEQIAKINAAVAARNARKEAAMTENVETESGATESSATTKTREDRAAARAQRNAERAQKRAEKAEVRAARRAEREAARSNRVVHMSKVERAAERLPSLTENAQAVFNTAAGLTAIERAALAQHLNHAVRVESTAAAVGSKVKVGQTVEITGGALQYVGMTGVVVEAHRIRCYVELPTMGNKKIYLFTSDVNPVVVPGVEEEPVEEAPARTVNDSAAAEASV